MADDLHRALKHLHPGIPFTIRNGELVIWNGKPVYAPEDEPDAEIAESPPDKAQALADWEAAGKPRRVRAKT